jgi:protein-S-isoprenylcysteine O-methyltransferase Ste14
MKLDIRMPMGVMFVLVGAILTVYGVATSSDTELYRRSLGLNINLIWGIVLLVIGVVMVILARRAMQRTVDATPPSGEGKNE